MKKQKQPETIRWVVENISPERKAIRKLLKKTIEDSQKSSMSGLNIPFVGYKIGMKPSRTGRL